MSSEQKMDKRDFRLTSAGTVLLESSGTEVAEFWQRWSRPVLTPEVDSEFRLIGPAWQTLDETVNRRLLAHIGTMDLRDVQAVRLALVEFQKTLAVLIEPAATGVNG